MMTMQIIYNKLYRTVYIAILRECVPDLKNSSLELSPDRVAAVEELWFLEWILASICLHMKARKTGVGILLVFQ